VTPRLRPARSTDAGKLGDILGAAIRGFDWKPVLHSGAEDIAHCGRMIDRGWVTVAVDDETRAVLGFIAREDTRVHALFVAEAARGQGIGAALLQDAMDRSEELTLWTFEANDGARRFYDRFGFAESARGDGSANEERLPDVQLRWTAPKAPQTPEAPQTPQTPQTSGAPASGAWPLYTSDAAPPRPRVAPSRSPVLKQHYHISRLTLPPSPSTISP